MRGFVISLLLLIGWCGGAEAACPASPSSCPSPIYNGLTTLGAATVGGLLNGNGMNVTSPGAALVWGSGPLANGHAPIFQDVTGGGGTVHYTGTTTAGWSAFGMWLRQSDNSSNSLGSGISENLFLDGPNVIGDRQAAAFLLQVDQTTGNSVGQGYDGVVATCNLFATDPSTSLFPAALKSTCFGGNLIGSLGAGVNGGVAGAEVDTFEGAGSTPISRIGVAIVDTGTGGGVMGPAGQDAALAINNQYAPTSTHGWRVGITFGDLGGSFPIATGGTMIVARGPGMTTAFTVANGIDWSLGTFTGNSWNDGHTILTGAGEVIVAKITDPNTAPGAGDVKITAEAGTTTGTCKIVVRAGTSATPITLLDNIGSGC